MMSSLNEKIIIILLNYNQVSYTLKCVESLLKSDYENYLILLIDNGSTLENRELLKKSLPNNDRLMLKVLDNNRGYVGGINVGFEEGNKLHPDYFLIMNNDTIIDKEAITKLYRTIKNYDDNAIVSGKVYHYDEPNRLQFVGYKYRNKKTHNRIALGVNEIDKGQYDSVEERDMLDDIFWLFPSELYDKIGGYSPYFWFNSEQADFALRAKKENFKLVFTPNAKLWHKGSVSVGGRDLNPRLAYWTIQSKLILNYLHLNKIDFIKLYIKILISISRTFIKSIYHKLAKKENLFEYALAKYKGLVYFNKWMIKKNENTGYNPF